MGDSEDKIEPEEIEQIFSGLPVTLNVGFPTSLGGPGLDTTVIGWSSAYRNKGDGRSTIVIALDPEASEMLKDLAGVFDLKAIGFAGIKRREQ